MINGLITPPPLLGLYRKHEDVCWFQPKNWALSCGVIVGCFYWLMGRMRLALIKTHQWWKLQKLSDSFSPSVCLSLSWLQMKFGATALVTQGSQLNISNWWDDTSSSQPAFGCYLKFTGTQAAQLPAHHRGHSSHSWLQSNFFCGGSSPVIHGLWNQLSGERWEEERHKGGFQWSWSSVCQILGWAQFIGKEGIGRVFQRGLKWFFISTCQCLK